MSKTIFLGFQKTVLIFTVALSVLGFVILLLGGSGYSLLILIGVCVYYFHLLFIFYGITGVIIYWDKRKSRDFFLFLTAVGIIISGYVVVRELIRIPQQKEEYRNTVLSFNFGVYLPEYLPSGYQPDKIMPEQPRLDKNKILTALYTRKLPNEEYGTTIIIHENEFNLEDETARFPNNCIGAMKNIEGNFYKPLQQPIDASRLYTSNNDNFRAEQHYCVVLDKTLIELIVYDPNNIGSYKTVTDHSEIIRLLSSLKKIDSSNTEVFIDKEHTTRFNWALWKQ